MQSQPESREVLIHDQARNHIWSEETGWVRKEVLVLEASKIETTKLKIYEENYHWFVEAKGAG